METFILFLDKIGQIYLTMPFRNLEITVTEITERLFQNSWTDVTLF